MLAGIDDPPRGRFRAWADEPGDDTLDALIDGADRSAPPKPAESPRITILTSGTTGTPKGAPRSEPRSLSLIGGLLSKVPFRAREVDRDVRADVPRARVHAGDRRGRPRLDARGPPAVRPRGHARQPRGAPRDRDGRRPGDALADGDLGEEEVKQRDTSALRIIFVSGSALGADLAKRATELFGPVIYNLYGSTEVAYATIATPEDLREEPSSVGKVVRGSIVKLLDDDGKEVGEGDSGRIFVGNLSQFEGYTGGGNKDMVQGLMASGDVGHFDSEGRLYIDGRDDEMIVSGGENVFPAEIEELLGAHEAIEEAAAIGVDDEKFGQRLKAFVVLQKGAKLSEDEIKDYVKDNLASYKVPREVVFLDELPRNPTGKVLKRELEEQDDDDAGSGDEKPEAEKKEKAKTGGVEPVSPCGSRGSRASCARRPRRPPRALRSAGRRTSAGRPGTRGSRGRARPR